MIISKYNGAGVLFIETANTDKLDQTREAWTHLRRCYLQSVLLDSPDNKGPTYCLQAEILIQTIQGVNPNNFSRIRALLDCTDEEVERFLHHYALPGTVTLRVSHLHGSLTRIDVKRSK